MECLWWWPRRDGRDPEDDEGVRELSDVVDAPPNLNPVRSPSLLGCLDNVVTGAGTSTLSSSIVGSGNVPGRGKNMERFLECIRLWLWRLAAPEDKVLCWISGAEIDWGKAKVLNEGESGEGGNFACRGEKELDKGDRRGGTNSFGFVDSDFVLE